MSHTYQHPAHPWCPHWSALEAEARGRGLIHGMRAHALIGGSPADAAMLLRGMVEHRVLRPVAKDLAGAGHSVRAFRGLQRLRESSPPQRPDVQQWLDGIPCEAADAHLWTFEIHTKE